ncbi:MAG: AsmA family protein [Paludibacteraceae bacterium]|nr:AsmA family protein [Paludibacteraceae bacterium]
MNAVVKKSIWGVIISLASIIALALFAVCTLVYVVFTPKRLTPIVNQVADSILTEPHTLDNVELTFFSTFPDFGLEIKNLCVKHSAPQAPTDTVFSIPSLVVTLNVESYFTQKKLDINGIGIKDATVNVFIDSLGNLNLAQIVDIPPDTVQTESSPLPFYFDINKVLIENCKASFIDMPDTISFTDVNLNLYAEADIDSTFSDIRADIEKLNLSWQSVDIDLVGNIAITDSLTADIQELNLDLGPLALSTDGLFSMAMDSTAGMYVDVNAIISGWQYSDIIKVISLKQWNAVPALGRIMSAIPASIPKEIEADMTLSTTLKMKGNLDDRHFPVIDNRLQISDLHGHYDLTKVPYSLDSTMLSVDTHFDMNHLKRSKVTVNDFSTRILSELHNGGDTPNTLHLTAQLTNMFPSGKTDKFNPTFDVNLNVGADVAEANLYVDSLLNCIADSLPSILYEIHNAYSPTSRAPAEVKKTINNIKTYTHNASVSGMLNLDVVVKHTRLNDIVELDWDSIYGDMTLNVNDIKVHALDGYDAGIGVLDYKVSFPIPDSTLQALKNYVKDVDSPDLMNFDYRLGLKNIKVDMPYLNIDIPNTTLGILGQECTDSTKKFTPTYIFDFKVDELTAIIDTDRLWIAKPYGEVYYRGSYKNPDWQYTHYTAKIDSIEYGFINYNAILIGQMEFKYEEEGDFSNYNDYVVDLKPDVYIDIENMQVVPIQTVLPKLVYTYRNQKAEITKSRIQIGESDFELTGNLNNVADWRSKSGNLEADLKFYSEKTNVDELLGIISSLKSYYTELGLIGNDNKPIEEPVAADSAKTSDNPMYELMASIPFDIDLALDADIKNAVIMGQKAKNLTADVYLNDGTCMLEDIAFESDLANINLNAKVALTQPKDGKQFGDSTSLDMSFKMHNIDIKKVIDIIPNIDSIMPMLRSLAGKVDVDYTASTLYNDKLELLPNHDVENLSISGTDLVIIPQNIYKTISKLLVFHKDATNKIDSLYAEAHYNNDTLSVYPFKIKLDKLLVAAGGNHTMNGNSIEELDYHVTVLKPVIIGVRIGGTIDNMDIGLEKPRYTKNEPVRYHEAQINGRTIIDDIKSTAEVFVDALRGTR